MVEARSVNYSQNFAIPNPLEEFQNDVARPSPAALSALNAALASAKSQHEREQLTEHWKAYMHADGAERQARGAARDLETKARGHPRHAKWRHGEG